MQITIIVPDNFVRVDGIALRMDMSQFDFSDAHVVQWSGDSGWIEYHDGRRNKPITDLTAEPFASVLREHEKLARQASSPDPD